MANFLRQYEKLLKNREKEIGKIDESFEYWQEILFAKCIKIFEWRGLPFPQKEIEMRLLTQGYCGFLKDGLKGIMVATGGMSGVSHYFDEFTTFTYAAPTASGGQKTIGKDCVIVDNSALRNPLFPVIERYAMLLAHSEVSLKVALINLRMTNTFACDSEATASTITAAREKIYTGSNDVIVDKSLIGINSLVNLSPAGTNNTGVMDCIDARNEILRAFFAEIGVRYNRDKKERMIESEVASDEQFLLINISDMLTQRQTACEKINKLFGLNVSVELSKEWELLSTNTKKDGGQDDAE